MTKEEMDYFVNDNMNTLKYVINDIPNHFPFNLAKNLSDQHRYCDIQKLYDVINNKLAPKYRAALILRYKYKYTYKRIEEALGYSSGYGRTVVNRIHNRLRNYYDIYVYDKKYITSSIKDYDHEIDIQKEDIRKLEKYKDYLMDQVLKDNPNIDRSSLISKMDNASKLMNTSIDVLELSPRAYFPLNRKYYNNLYQLSRVTIEELYNIPGLGISGVKEIVDKLYYNGIYIEHETIKNIHTGVVKYISKEEKDSINYKSWELI